MNKTLRRIDVEPLSEQRWQKIERTVFARLELTGDDSVSRPERGRSPALRLGLVAAALGVLALVALLLTGMPEGGSIDHPSRITTGPSASHLALPGLSLDVEPESEVVIDPETSRGQLIVLERGTIVCQVSPRSSKTPLMVQAGAARVRVIGTRFRVSRSGETARVQVEEGTVEVTSRGRSWRVAAGEEWPSKPSDGSAVEGPDAQRAPALPAGRERPIGAPTDDVAGVPVEGKRAETATGRLAAEKPFPARPVMSARPSSSSAARSASSDPGAGVAEGAPGVASARPSPQAAFERATALERSDPARASELYRSLESGADSWAQNALYARGRLAAARGDADEARRLLERYLERFPRGSNAEDARAVLRRLR